MQQQKITTHGTIEHLEKQVKELKFKNDDGGCVWGDMGGTVTDDMEFIGTVRQELPLVSDGLAAAENRIAELNKDVETLTNDLKVMEQKLKNHVRRWHLEEDSSLQYSMRDSIIVSGATYNRDENTNQIMCKIANSIGVDITEQDISVSHRTGRVQGNTPRPIVVKFVRRDTKHLVLQNKKFARNIKCDEAGNPVRIFLDEHLTPMRRSFCKKLREKNVHHYTWDGKIHVFNGEDNSKSVIDTPDDWERCNMPEEYKAEVGIVWSQTYL